MVLFLQCQSSSQWIKKMCLLGSMDMSTSNRDCCPLIDEWYHITLGESLWTSIFSPIKWEDIHSHSSSKIWQLWKCFKIKLRRDAGDQLLQSVGHTGKNHGDLNLEVKMQCSPDVVWWEMAEPLSLRSEAGKGCKNFKNLNHLVGKDLDAPFFPPNVAYDKTTYPNLLPALWLWPSHLSKYYKLQFPLL